MKPITETFVTNTNNIDLNIYQVGYEYCRPGHTYGPAVRQHYLFHYIIDGKGSFYTAHGTFSLKKGQGFLIFPDDVTTYSADLFEPWHYMWIEMDGLKVKEHLVNTGITKIMPIFTPNHGSESPDEKLMLSKVIEEAAQNSLSMIGYGYLFLDALIKNAVTSQPIIPKYNQSFYVGKAISYIERRYHDALTVQEIAGFCKINRSYLGRLFQAEMAVSPQHYLLQYRMNLACSLLMKRELSIKAISNSVGYANQLHFSRAFKTIYGRSPLQWRNEQLLSQQLPLNRDV